METTKPIDIAIGEMGTASVPGAGVNPEIIAYFAKTGNSWVKDDETAWCAAFVGYCLETAGVKSTGALNARSYLEWGIGTVDPKFGDIVVFSWDKTDTVHGHVGFFVAQDGANIYTLGGNQSDKVCIKKYDISNVLNFRKEN